jgi:hypothetical protein
VSHATPLKLFFSWQIDAPTHICRNFIEKALNRALVQLAASVEVENAVREAGMEVDRDTLDAAGLLRHSKHKRQRVIRRLREFVTSLKNCVDTEGSV